MVFRTSPRTLRRSGFTLLEVLLAAVISIALFYGLYQAMQLELHQANEGREVIERSTLSRAIINRIAIDLTTSLGPIRPTPKAAASSSSSGSSSSTSGSSTSGSSTGGSSTSGSSSTDSSSSTTAQAATQATSAIPLQAGLIGYSDRLIIYASQTPDPRLGSTLYASQSMSNNNANLVLQVPSDLRRISYWLGANGGLCRQEVPWYSSDTFASANDITMEDGMSDDDYIIAREITDLGFEYYDINSTDDDTGWSDSWDGTVPGPDGITPQGPPTAIRVRFTIKLTDATGESTSKDYLHVIPILTATGPNTSATTGSTTSGSSTSGMQ